MVRSVESEEDVLDTFLLSTPQNGKRRSNTVQDTLLARSCRSCVPFRQHVEDGRVGECFLGGRSLSFALGLCAERFSFGCA